MNAKFNLLNFWFVQQIRHDIFADVLEFIDHVAKILSDYCYRNKNHNYRCWSIRDLILNFPFWDAQCTSSHQSFKGNVTKCRQLSVEVHIMSQVWTIRAILFLDNVLMTSNHQTEVCMWTCDVQYKLQFPIQWLSN